MSRPKRLNARLAVMEAALELYTFHPNASLDDVAARAGVGRATLFRHFPNRTALLRAAGAHVIAELDAALVVASIPADATPQQHLRSLLAVMVDAGLPLHAVFGMAELAEDAELQAALQVLDRHIEPVVAECRAAGLFDAHVPPAWIEAAFDGLLYAAWAAIHKGTLAPAHAPDLLLHTMLHGFGTVRPP